MADEQGPVCVSVINMKGGVGKTTIAALLARHAASQRDLREYDDDDDDWGFGFRFVPRYDVLAIDLDPQANLSQALMGANLYRQFLDDNALSVVEVFNGYQSPSSPLDAVKVVHEVTTNLHLIPSRFDFSDNLIRSIGTDERVLARMIANSFQDKDLILIDCAPTESIFTQVAYHVSNSILVPVKPEFLATIGFPLLEDSLTNFRNRNPAHPLDVIGIVINDTFDYQATRQTPEKRTALGEIRDEAEKNGWYIFENGLEYSRGFPKMMRGNRSYLGDAPDIFRRFADEFFDRLMGSQEDN